jgi:general secretion pathway protein E
MIDEQLNNIVAEKDRILSEHLVTNGLVTAKALRASLMEQNITHENLGLILVQNGCLSHDELVEAMLSITDESLIDEELILAYIPPSLLQKHRAMIVAETAHNVYIATLGDHQSCSYDLARFFPKQNIRFIPANIEKIENYHAKLSKIHNSDQSILEKIMRKAIMHGASDIHIMPKRGSYSIFLRILGENHLDYEGSLDEYNKVSAMIKDRAKMDLAERRKPQDGSYTIEYNGRYIDLRVGTVPAKMGEVIVMRILDPEKTNVKLKNLGITDVEDWHKAISRSDGIILICGTTGSGKTTTLTATIREMDRLGKAIYTAEDPVEYNQPFVRQVNINDVVGLDYSAAIKAFMRADPDIIIIGEIRDLNTARNAIKAAETGHLVIATMHTSSIAGSITRLRDLGVEPHEIKYILRGVLTQKLMKVLCKKCEGKGCEACMKTGYGSRTIISECKYFRNKDEVEHMINGGKPTWSTIIEDAFAKYDNGQTNFDELLYIFGDEAVVLEQQRNDQKKIDKNPDQAIINE